MKKAFKRIALLAALFLFANSTSFSAETPLSAEAPPFYASIAHSSNGYIVNGTIPETPPDVSIIQTMYSLDGDIYQDCEEPWDPHLMDRDDDGVPEKLQSQACLYSSQEPLKSYLDKKLDHFFLKLRLVLQDGTTYETHEVLIDRGDPQPIPQDLVPEAAFAPSVAAYEKRPFCGFGKYQLTIREDAAPEEIASFLPDTLPVEIQLFKGLNCVSQGIVDCPVTWKALPLPPLAAGESVTIYDAAEELVIPKDTLVNTPTGIFRLDEPLKLNQQYGLTDEVRLILNVISKDEAPTGALTAENTGLEMAFYLKPTGATEIKAYVWTENSPVWISLPDTLLLDAVNEQPSTASSDYALVIGCGQEPYKSYLDEKAAGDTPTPFFIGLTIKGGVYDGKQLILSWPDTYEILPSLPKLEGSGGNELNAGAGNENDSTPEGQRPNLPHDSQNQIQSEVQPLHHNVPGRIDQRQKTDYIPDVPISRLWLPLSNTLDVPLISNRTEMPETKKEEIQKASDLNNNPHSTEDSTTSLSETTHGSRTSVLLETEDDSPGLWGVPNLQEKPAGGVPDRKNRRILQPSTTTTTAIIWIGIGTVALIMIGIASRRAGRKSNPLSGVLQKLHQKCRAFSRR